MIYNFFAQKDSTIYEEFLLSSLNTGIDEILSIGKILSGSVSTVPVNSRVLLKFDINQISQSIQNGTIQSGSQYFLKLKSTKQESIPREYSLYFHPVSQSWENGTGRYSNYPQTTNGVSWKYREVNTLWATESYAANTTASWSSIPGGSTYYTNYVVSQSYTVDSNDISVNVTPLVTKWLEGIIPDEGFLIKRSDIDEQSNTEQGILNFYSIDSSTVYSPKLEIAWSDATQAITSSTLDIDNMVLYPSNLMQNYKRGSIATIKLKARPQYPTRQFVTSSNYLKSYNLPTESYYEVRDVRTNNTIVSASTYTKLSNNSSSENYFKFRMDGLEAERYYKFVFKVEKGGGVQYFDNGYLFKIKL